mgnify:CR=1 FL=1
MEKSYYFFMLFFTAIIILGIFAFTITAFLFGYIWIGLVFSLMFIASLYVSIRFKQGYGDNESEG